MTSLSRLLRPVLLAAAVALVGAGALLTPRAEAAATRPPNIVFFLIDDWGWTDAGSFGSKL
jgi:hypothetical protein